MEILFETRREIKSITGKVYFEQCSPTIHTVPVIRPSTKVDSGGAYVYGSILRDGGRLRMWYQAVPEDWDGRDVSLVGYAESDDGLEWRKPVLGIVDYGGKDNNLCNLGFHSPAVFIDPHAPSGARYRATGYSNPKLVSASDRVTAPGYYSAHSADGLNWTLDGDTPRWPYADVITSAYHPTQDRAIVCLKRNMRVAGIPRRCVWSAEFRNGEWSGANTAMIPDEFDDVCAITRGFASGDYYGMGMMPAGSGTVGFLWQFRHSLPRTAKTGSGVFGPVDISLTYQERRGDRWLHSPGRQDFLAHGVTPWASGCIYTSSCPVEVGDEQWLYFSGEPFTHGWYLDSEWNRREERMQQMMENGYFSIGVARWKRDRLFSFASDPEGAIELELCPASDNPRLILNYRTGQHGSVRAEVADNEGFGADDSSTLSGEEVSAPVRWKAGERIPAKAGEVVKVRLHLDRATIYAYEMAE